MRTAYSFAPPRRVSSAPPFAQPHLFAQKQRLIVLNRYLKFERQNAVSLHYSLNLRLFVARDV